MCPSGEGRLCSATSENVLNLARPPTGSQGSTQGGPADPQPLCDLSERLTCTAFGRQTASAFNKADSVDSRTVDLARSDPSGIYP